MPADRVFIDTAALLALINRDDALHDTTTEVYSRLTRERAFLVTTEWVLAEFLNGASRPPARSAAAKLVGALRASSRVSINPASHDSFERALALYSTRPDKEWSLVDCGSIGYCLEQQITRVLTHDHHFAQAGLIPLLRNA